MKKADTSQDDYLLVKCALDGSEVAWNQLYNQSKQVVIGFTKKFMINYQIAAMPCEDIVGEAYCRAFIRLGTFKGQSRFSTWICGIVKRIVWNENKKNSRKERVYRHSIVPFAILYSRDPSDIYFELELSKSLWEAFENLRPIEAYILENHVVDCQTFYKLSKATHLSQNAVKKCYRKALCKYSRNFHHIHHKKSFV